MDKYVKVAKIGQGSFGSAFVVTKKSEPNGRKYVIKEIRVDPRDQQSALREAKLLAALDHPNIIACKESFMLQPASSGTPFGRVTREQVLCIVTEFADGGDLRKAIQRRTGGGKPLSVRPQYFQESEILDLFVQVCLALKHLHDRKIIHRDIKPENIFLSAGNVVKLGDFGVATVLSHTLACAETLTGTPYYTSPEICLGKKYNNKTDVWSLGCVLYELATFAHPFDGRSQRQLFDNIIRANYTPIAAVLAGVGSPSQYSTGLYALVSGMLMKNPRDRPSISTLLKTPIVTARIQQFLSERALAEELSHTVLHGHHIFRKNAPPPDKPLPNPARVVKASPRPLPPPPPCDIVKKAAATPSRVAVATPVGVVRRPERFDITKPVKAVPSPSKLGVGPARAKANGLLRRSRSVKKRVVQVGIKGTPAATPSDRSSSAGRKQAVAVNTPSGVRAVAASPVRRAPPSTNAKKPAITKAKSPAARKPTPKRVDPPVGADLPPPQPVVASKVSKGAVASRVAEFNAQWQAQRQQLLNNIAAAPIPAALPPPAPIAANKAAAAGPAAKAYPKPVEMIQVEGRSAGSRTKSGRNVLAVDGKPQKRGKKLPVSRDGIRQHIRAKKMEIALQRGTGAPQAKEASPFDDPVILVQNLPDYADSDGENSSTDPLPSLHDAAVRPPPPPQPASNPHAQPQIVQPANATEDSAVEEDESQELDGSNDSAVHPWPSAGAANLEFEKMVLQLKSVVDSANDDDDDDEDASDDDVLDEHPAIEPDGPPPAYMASASTTPSSISTIDTALLEQDAFKQALQTLLSNNTGEPNEAAKAEALGKLPPAHQPSLLWLHKYISTLLPAPTKLSSNP